MIPPVYVAIGIIVYGALAMLFAPRLARPRIFVNTGLKSPRGHRALTVAGEAFGLLLIVEGVNRLFGASSVHDALDLLVNLSWLAALGAFLVAIGAEWSYRLGRHRQPLRDKVDGSTPK
jgi:hypothetical protein